MLLLGYFGQQLPSRVLTSDPHQKLAGGSIVRPVIDSIANKMVSFWKLGSWLWAPAFQSGLQRQKGFQHRVTREQTSLNPSVSPLSSLFDDAVSRILCTGWIPINCGGQFARLCCSFSRIWAPDLRRVYVYFGRIREEFHGNRQATELLIISLLFQSKDTSFNNCLFSSKNGKLRSNDLSVNDLQWLA